MTLPAPQPLPQGSGVLAALPAASADLSIGQGASASGIDALLWSFLDPEALPSAEKSLEAIQAALTRLSPTEAARRLCALSMQHVMLREILTEEAAHAEADAVFPGNDSPLASRAAALLPSPTDTVLVTQAARGVAGAFDVLVERYFTLVVGVAYTLLADSDQARDVAQEAFLEAARTLNSLREKEKFGHWVYGIARRKAIYVLRRKKLHRGAIEFKKEENRSQPPQDEPGAPMDRQERAQSVREALNKLPEIYREILVLKYMDGRSYEEIAALLSISLAAVDKRLTRGKAMLRDVLGSGTL